MERLIKLHSKRQKRVIGLISGTSLDGVDAALVQIHDHGLETKLDLLHFITFPYPVGLKDTLLRVSTPGKGSVDEICRLNVLLGEIFADAVKALLDDASVDPASIDLIGSHGQTVQHLPKPRSDYDYLTRSTLQLGEPSVIAKRTGMVTVADFRPADMALGGQGAPLVPYFDFVIFRSEEKTRGMLNLGGIANLTVLHPNCPIDEVLAFDTGPANLLVDGLMQRLYGKPFDEDGQTAQSGRICEELLDQHLRHKYFSKKPPKSTGREEFGEAFSEKFLGDARACNLRPEDIIASAAELTARSVWNNYRDFVAANKTEFDELIVSGGGVKNRFIMDSLRQKFASTAVKPTDEYGIPADAKEAICFAVLANETIAGNPNNVPAASGAQQPTIMGKICL